MRRFHPLLVIGVIVSLAAPGYLFSGTPNVTSLVPGEIHGGWAENGQPRVFTKETLFEHINGQADLFLQYGFERSVFTVYRNKDSSRGKIDLPPEVSGAGNGDSPEAYPDSGHTLDKKIIEAGAAAAVAASQAQEAEKRS